MTEPLPCPFCGYVGVNVHQASTYRWVVAECNYCGAQCGEVRRNTMEPSTDAEDKSLAIAEWNKRTGATFEPPADFSCNQFEGKV